MTEVHLGVLGKFYRHSIRIRIKTRTGSLDAELWLFYRHSIRIRIKTKKIEVIKPTADTFYRHSIRIRIKTTPSIEISSAY